MSHFLISSQFTSINNKTLMLQSYFVLFLFYLMLSESYSSSLDFKGYATLRVTNANNFKKIPYYHAYADDKINFTENNHVGLQIFSEIKKDFDFRMTLSMSGRDNYITKAEWAYLSYKINKQLSLRLGRVNAPFYMLTDYINIGYTYPWVTPPVEVYSTNPITAVDGIDIIYNRKGAIDFLFEVYAGSQDNNSTIPPNFVDSPANVNNITKGSTIKFTTYNMVGVNTKLGGDDLYIRAGYFQTSVDASQFNIIDTKGKFTTFGLYLDKYNFVIISESVFRDTDKKLERTFPDQTAYYFTLGYRFSKLLLYVSSAKLDKGSDKSIYALKQTSESYGFRYEINHGVDIKFEVTNVKPGFKSNDIGQYGLFDSPVTQESQIFTMTMDVIF